MLFFLVAVDLLQIRLVLTDSVGFPTGDARFLTVLLWLIMLPQMISLCLSFLVLV